MNHPWAIIQLVVPIHNEVGSVANSILLSGPLWVVKWEATHQGEGKPLPLPLFYVHTRAAGMGDFMSLIFPRRKTPICKDFLRPSLLPPLPARIMAKLLWTENSWPRWRIPDSSIFVGLTEELGWARELMFTWRQQLVSSRWWLPCANAGPALPESWIFRKKLEIEICNSFTESTADPWTWV